MATTREASLRSYRAPVPAEDHAGRAVRYLSAAARLSLGWVFLWAFLDKVFGWGRATAAGKGWIDGGSPTAGLAALTYGLMT